MLLVLKDQPPEGLPSVAADALMAGFDSPSLRQLAGMQPSDYQQARDVFMAALRELGLPVPEADDARWCLVREWAQEMLDGQRSSHEASKLIWWRGWEPSG